MKGDLYKKICGELRGFAGLYLDEPLHGNSKEIWIILSKVLDEAKKDFLKTPEEIRKKANIEEKIKGMSGFQQAYFRASVERDYLRLVVLKWFGDADDGEVTQE
jgi:hypothetical protein